MLALGRYLSTFVVLLSLYCSAHGLDNGLGLLPPMGYNSWNDLKLNVNEDVIKDRADAMVKLGFVEAGYVYLNMDDGWSQLDRHPETGELQPVAEAFPSGIAELSKYVRSKGMKLGIYTDRGTKTCGGRAGSYENEYKDAKTFAKWGIEFVKNDNCHAPGGPNNQEQALKYFSIMRDALNATGVPIFYSVCGGGDEIPIINDISWYAKPPFGKQLANSWRISPDVGAPLGLSWPTLQSAMARNSVLQEFAGPGGWNDPDMLLTSNKRASMYLNDYQSRTQFSVWCVMAAPLIIGGPVGDLSDWDKETFLNKELIAVNQDPSAQQGIPLLYTEPLGTYSIWGRKLHDGSLVMVLVNNFLWAKTVTCDAQCWEKTGLAAGTRLAVRDLWTHAAADPAEHVASEPFSVGIGGTGHSRTFKFSPQTHEEEGLSAAGI